MNEYRLDSRYSYESRTVTKGTQKKYYRDSYYYKVNKSGNEGYTEYLVSRLLKHSTLVDRAYVKYEYCKINGKLGCRSKDFLDENEDFITLSTIHERITGKTSLADEIAKLGNANDRLEYILDIANAVGIPKQSYTAYMKILMQLDWLIVNTDRHAHNYGAIYNRNTGKFRAAPIFDNGLSLNTDRSGNTTACTLSGSFDEQIIAFGYPITPAFKIDYVALRKDLNRIEKLYGKHMELEVLRDRLEKCKRVFDK